MSTDGYYFWWVWVLRNRGWEALQSYPTRHRAELAAADIPGLTRVVRGDKKPLTTECRVCGTWECADCGETRYYTLRVIDHCLACGSKLGRMRPVRHSIGSRLALKHAR